MAQGGGEVAAREAAAREIGQGEERKEKKVVLCGEGLQQV